MIVSLDEPIISMEDRGYQFGDGVYEVTKVYNGRLFAFAQHRERLYRSLRELRIPAVWTAEELQQFHQLLIAESGIKDGGVYLQITRGVAPRAHNFPENVVPKLTMSIRPAGSANASLRETGAKILFAPDERWLRCDIKSLNLLGNLMAKQKAKEAGCFEAVMIRDGVITEGSSSNFMIVKDGVLWTHPLGNLILKGVTRTLIVEKIAPELGLPVIEKAFNTSFAGGADEAFVCGTNTEIVPVVTMDNNPVANGQVGAVTRKLQQAFNKLIDIECQRN
ncbi:D-amino acid aminotransferase [Acetonema longum DSM 6540]|uniref:D-alanine aminotransferase n=2 Tax=Acetonema TaxID=2373 RepID=F7NQ73_9FIRM|nr:D-amino acid aminotransferase [Acetonema longum DSM 6540]